MAPPPRELSANWKSIKARVTKKEQAASVSKPSVPSKDLWFDVDDQSLKRSEYESRAAGQKTQSILDLFPEPSSTEHAKDAGKYVAIDCEMVGVGPDGLISALARVSIVNFNGKVLLDRYSRPIERVTDYRTEYSGIEPHHLLDATSLSVVQQEVWDILQGKILVGHSLKNDFKALLLEHPKRTTRDTSKYRPFRKISQGKSPSLKRLAKNFLGVDIQTGAHDSVDDARIAMLLYRSRKDEWENYLFRNEGKAYKKHKRLGSSSTPTVVSDK